MDNPATESTAGISVSDAANLFAPPQEEQQAQVTVAVETPKELPAATQTETVTAEASEEDTLQVEMVEVDIDGYKVQVPKDKAETLEKQRLMQADYTKKRMADAEKGRALEAETAKARAERQQYAQGLQQARAILQAQLHEQSQSVDWDRLVVDDPSEYQRQRHLHDSRQAKLQHILGQQGQLTQIEANERKQVFYQNLAQEHQAVLETLPEWKDEKKRQAENAMIVEDLISRGFSPLQVIGKKLDSGIIDPDAPGITDHKLILLARDAALYRQMMSKAQAAAKKVSTLPQKVERPGVSETSPLDGRTAAMKRLEKSGTVRDAAAVFSLLS